MTLGSVVRILHIAKWKTIERLRYHDPRFNPQIGTTFFATQSLDLL